MSPDEQLSDDELKTRSLKLIQTTWKTITSEKQKGTDVGTAEEKIVNARKAIKDKDFKLAYENATAGSEEMNKILGVEPEPTPASAPTPAPTPVPTPEPEAAPEPEPVPTPEPEPTPVPTPEPTPESAPADQSASDTFSMGVGEAPAMPEPIQHEEAEVDAEKLLAQPEPEPAAPAPPKPILFLCFNCNEPISVTVTERPLIVKCPNCGIDGQID